MKQSEMKPGDKRLHIEDESIPEQMRRGFFEEIAHRAEGPKVKVGKYSRRLLGRQYHDSRIDKWYWRRKPNKADEIFIKENHNGI